VRRLLLLLLAPLLLGCGAGEESGTASLWITRDRGASVVLVTKVPAGLTAMQALRRKADVETRYGGRYVQAIGGVEGSLSGGRDWFYFVNGVEADRSAAEYRLRPGDVEWWDFRSWRGRTAQQVVVGAFPEPFVHGYDGRVSPVVVRYEQARLRDAARAIAARVDADDVRPQSVAVPERSDVLTVVGGPTRLEATREASGRIRFVASADVARRLARDPAAYRFRYEVGG
jgi:hypothetical protein